VLNNLIVNLKPEKENTLLIKKESFENDNYSNEQDIIDQEMIKKSTYENQEKYICSDKKNKISTNKKLENKYSEKSVKNRDFIEKNIQKEQISLSKNLISDNKTQENNYYYSSYNTKYINPPENNNKITTISDTLNNNKKFNQFNNKELIEETSSINLHKDYNNTSLNKEGNSLLNDLESKNDSKILNSNHINILITPGNEYTSSRSFNNLHTPRNIVSSAIAAAKDFTKQKTLNEKTNPLKNNPKNNYILQGRQSLNNTNDINQLKNIKELKKSSTLKNTNIQSNNYGKQNNSAIINKYENKNKNNNNSSINSSNFKENKFNNKYTRNLRIQNSLKHNQSDFQLPIQTRKSIIGKIVSARSLRIDNKNTNILSDIQNTEAEEISSRFSPDYFKNIISNKSFSKKSNISSSDYKSNETYRNLSEELIEKDMDLDLTPRKSRSFKLNNFFNNNKFFIKKKKNIFTKKNLKEILQDNHSSNSLPRESLCEILKIRINQNHIICRESKETRYDKKFLNNKEYSKTKRDKFFEFKIERGEYKLIDDFNASFNLKCCYHSNELCMSPSAAISINQKDISKEILILPPNYRKEQKEELSQRLSEKLQGNFIDESITKISKMNSLDRIKNNRIASSSISPKRVLNNLCFSPLNNKNILITENYNNEALKSPAVFSDRTLRYSSNKDESINTSEAIKMQKKIGNSNVKLMDNNFMIFSGDEEKVYSPLDSYLENHFSSERNSGLMSNTKIKNNRGINANNDFAKNAFENKACLYNSKDDGNGEQINNKNQKYVTNSILNINNNLKKENDYIAVEASAFSITHFDNNKKNSNIKDSTNQSSKFSDNIKKIKNIEPQNVVNLYYQMHPEKNKFGLYSFRKNDEDFTSNSFSLLKPNNHKSLYYGNVYSNLKVLNYSLEINNPINESVISATQTSQVNKKNDFSKLKINHNNFELENSNSKMSNLEKKQTEYIKDLKNMTSNVVQEKLLDYEKDNGEKSSPNIIILKTDSNEKMNILESNYNLTLDEEVNNKNNLVNLRKSFKDATHIINNYQKNLNTSIINTAPTNNIFLDNKNSFAENIRRNKENFNDADFFEKMKNFLDSKRIETEVIEQAYLNTETNINFDIRNRPSLNKIENINRSLEKQNNSKNKSAYNSNNLAIVSSGSNNFPLSENLQNYLNTEPIENSKNIKDALHKLNELDSKSNLDANKLVLPMNTRSNQNLRLNSNSCEKNRFEESNLEILSEKIKRDKQIEALNQRFHEKLNILKSQKNNYKNNFHDSFHDFEFENFKNEFKRNNNNNGFSSNERFLTENTSTFSNINSGKIENKREEILITDEQLSEFKDKFLGKLEFIDKENLKMFYKKYLKGGDANNNKMKNQTNCYKEEKRNQFSNASKEEQEVSIRLEKLKNMLKIDDHKKNKELKNLNSHLFLYERNINANEPEKILNNLNSSSITNYISLNDSKINYSNVNTMGNIDYNKNMDKISLKCLGNKQQFKIGNSNSNIVLENNNNKRDLSMITNQILPSNQLNFANRNNTTKNSNLMNKDFNFNF